MMGRQPDAQQKLFYTCLNLEKRIRKDHILRKIAQHFDFNFIYKQVEDTYGTKGNMSVPQYEKAIKYLEDAINLNPSALVANIMLAQAFERIGKAEKAICAYKSASEDPLCESETLKKYITNQLERIKTKGPSKKPPMPGPRHLGMGR